jgi:hypothetical protein
MVSQPEGVKPHPAVPPGAVPSFALAVLLAAASIEPTREIGGALAHAA